MDIDYEFEVRATKAMAYDLLVDYFANSKESIDIGYIKGVIDITEKHLEELEY